MSAVKEGGYWTGIYFTFIYNDNSISFQLESDCCHDNNNYTYKIQTDKYIEFTSQKYNPDKLKIFKTLHTYVCSVYG